MKHSHFTPRFVTPRSSAAFLLAGILSLGVGVPTAQAANYYFIPEEGSFVDTANWSPEATSPPANDVRYITNGGTATFSDGDTLSINELHLGVGSLVMTGGTLTTGQNGGWTRIGDYVYNGNATSSASLTMSGSAKIASLQPFYFAYGTSTIANSAVATANLSGTASISGTNSVVIGKDGGTATVTLSGNSSISKTTTTGVFYVGEGANADGTLIVKDDATVSSAQSFTIGRSGAKGKVTLTDNAQLTVNGERVWIGGESSSGSTGELALSGNATMTYTGSNQYGFTVADAGTTGTLTLSESSSLTSTSTTSPLLLTNGSATSTGTTATVTVGGTASVLDIASYIVVGQRGATGTTASLNINTGGTVKADYVIVGGSSSTTASGVNGTINLNGGVLQTKYVAKGLNTSDATRNLLNVNGGTLKATADQADFIQNGLYVNVQSGGLKIDTQGYEVGILSADLTGEGGLTKLGSGTLSVFSTLNYTGSTTVSEGLLSIDGGSLTNSLSLSVASGAGLELTSEFSLNDGIVWTLESGANVNLNYTGTEVIYGLLIGGSAVEAGTYSLLDLQGLTGGVTFTGLSGANLTVMTTVPEPTEMTLAVAGLLGVLAVSRRRRMRAAGRAA